MRRFVSHGLNQISRSRPSLTPLNPYFQLVVSFRLLTTSNDEKLNDGRSKVKSLEKPGASDVSTHDLFREAVQRSDYSASIELFNKISLKEGPLVTRRLTQLIHLLSDSESHRIEASHLLNRIRTTDLSGAESAFNRVINGHISADETELALKRFRQAKLMGVYVDLLTLQNFIALLCSNNLDDTLETTVCLIEILDYIRAQEMVLGGHVYHTAIKYMLSVPNFSAVGKVLELMKRSGMLPLARTCKSIYSALLFRSANHEIELFKEVKRISREIYERAKIGGISKEEMNLAEEEYKKTKGHLLDLENLDEFSSDSEGLDESDREMEEYQLEMNERLQRSVEEMRELSNLNYLRKKILREEKVQKKIEKKKESPKKNSKRGRFRKRKNFLKKRNQTSKPFWDL